MQTDLKLSTRILTTQNAHQVAVLVTLSGEAPARRAPINVALVLAVRRADEGDLDGAAGTLREAAMRLDPLAKDDAALAEMKEDLEAEAERCAERLYEAKDRKYNLARSMAEASLRSGYVGKVSRRPRPPRSRGS